MDQIFTSQFWYEQWTVITSAPWLVIPLLLLAGLVGWMWKSTNDDGEIRGLRAGLKAAAQRLKLAEEKLELAGGKYVAVVNQIGELSSKMARQDRAFAELVKTLVVSPLRVNQFVVSNIEIQNVVRNLSASTTGLGQALEAIKGSFARTRQSAPDRSNAKRGRDK